MDEILRISTNAAADLDYISARGAVYANGDMNNGNGCLFPTSCPTPSSSINDGRHEHRAAISSCITSAQPRNQYCAARISREFNILIAHTSSNTTSRVQQESISKRSGVNVVRRKRLARQNEHGGDPSLVPVILLALVRCTGASAGAPVYACVLDDENGARALPESWMTTFDVSTASGDDDRKSELGETGKLGRWTSFRNPFLLVAAVELAKQIVHLHALRTRAASSRAAVQMVKQNTKLRVSIRRLQNASPEGQSLMQRLFIAAGWKLLA